MFIHEVASDYRLFINIFLSNSNSEVIIVSTKM